MYSLEKYYKDINLLTNSLVVKISDVAYSINKGLLIKFGIETPDDMREWKYYMNIAGEKHQTNLDVKITVLETDEERSLTKELLNNYPSTKQELLLGGSYYEELISKYPTEYQYIHGCMLSVDKERAIQAPEGTILAFNDNYIEEQEISIINDLEDHIKGFLKRWNIANYSLTDPLYVPSLLSVLFSTIPNKINNLRIANINTYKVHSFHMEHMFRSHMDIWENIQPLNKKTQFWLYKNLKYLLKHVGRNETFHTIIQKVFEENGIGVGEYELIKKDPNIDINKAFQSDNTDYITSDILFRSNKLNRSYLLSDNKEVSLDTMILSEMQNVLDLDTEILNEHSSHIKDDSKYVINKEVKDDLQTKILDIESIKPFKLHGMDPILSIMFHWVYLAATDRYTRESSFIDPNTKNKYDLSPYQGYLLLIKLLKDLSGMKENKIKTLVWDNILSEERIKQLDIFAYLHDAEYGQSIYDNILNSVPSIRNRYNNVNDFKDYMSEVLDFYKKVWYIESNVENPITCSNIKILLDRMMFNGSYDVSEEYKDIDTLLEENNIDFKTTDYYDIKRSITELFFTFTGLEIDPYKLIRELDRNYSQLLNKLTSYTTQVIQSTGDIKNTYVAYNGIGNIRANVGAIRVLDAEIAKPLETELAWIRGMGNDFRDDIDGHHLLPRPRGYICDDSNFGIGFIHRKPYKDIEANSYKPNNIAAATKECLPYYYPSVDAYGDDYDDTTKKIDNTNGVVGMSDARYIDDDVIAYTYDHTKHGPSGNVTRPNNIVDITDDDEIE